MGQFVPADIFISRQSDRKAAAGVKLILASGEGLPPVTELAIRLIDGLAALVERSDFLCVGFCDQFTGDTGRSEWRSESLVLLVSQIVSPGRAEPRVKVIQELPFLIELLRYTRAGIGLGIW